MAILNLKAALLSLLASSPLVAGWDSPGYDGYALLWQANFIGDSGTLPDTTTNWNIITGYLNVNAEWEEYTSSTANLQLSGGQTLQIVPWRDPSAQYGWTSARIESKYTFTPAAGEVTRAEAAIRFGANGPGSKEGLWPAFWILGDSLRHGGSWPACGELDVMETVDGLPTGYGTAHCGTYPGGVCDEGTGLGGSVAIPDQGWHVWRIEWDRTGGAGYAAETITWYMDGTAFQSITGAQVGSAIWTSLAGSPLYFLLNMAVGGTWVGFLSFGLLLPSAGVEC